MRRRFRRLLEPGNAHEKQATQSQVGSRVEDDRKTIGGSGASNYSGRSRSSIFTSPTSPDSERLFPGGQTRGLRVLKEATDLTSEVDIIFIHGLTGDSWRTWHHPSGVYWPIDLLSQDLPGARILSFGYDADVAKLVGAVGKSNLRDHASTLVGEYGALRLRLGHERPRRLIIAAHSLGGLVAKKALCVSAESPVPDSQLLDRDTIGVCFLGTPHRGSELADYATIILRVLKTTRKRINHKIVEVLQPNSEVLNDLHESFSLWLLRNQDRSSVACFYEEHEMPGGMMVVPKLSATLDGCTTFPIPQNHSDMPKISDANDIGYRRILGQFQKWTRRGSTELKDTVELEIGTKVKGNCSQSGNTKPRNHSPPGMREDGIEDVRNEWLKALAFPEATSRQSNVYPGADNTCTWILGHPVYQHWVENPDSGILWILGNPGTGKTTLMKYLVEYLEITKSTRNHAILSFFFYNLGSHLQKSVDGLFRALLHQILRRFPDIVQDFVKLHPSLRTDEEIRKVMSAPMLLGLLEASIAAVLRDTHITLCIDALDECKDDTEGTEDTTESVRDLISRLKRTQAKLRSSEHALSLCCSSRHYPNLITTRDELRITVEKENTLDISDYVERRLEEETDADPITLSNTITQGAEGIFLWTDLVTRKAIKMLQDGKTMIQITEHVQGIPPRLSQLYRRNMESIPEQDRQLSRALFQFACVSKEPLDAASLRMLLSLQLPTIPESYSALTSSPNYIDDPVQLKRLVSSLSAGLAQLREPDEAGSSLDNDQEAEWKKACTGGPESLKLYLIHQSVKDYMLDEGLGFLQTKTSHRHRQLTDAHTTMAATYLNLLTMSEVNDASFKVTLPHTGAIIDDVIYSETHLRYGWGDVEIHDGGLRDVIFKTCQALTQPNFSSCLLEAMIRPRMAWFPSCQSRISNLSYDPKKHSQWRLPFYHIVNAPSPSDVEKHLISLLHRRFVSNRSSFTKLMVAILAIEHDLPFLFTFAFSELKNEHTVWEHSWFLKQAAADGARHTLALILENSQIKSKKSPAYGLKNVSRHCSHKTTGYCNCNMRSSPGQFTGALAAAAYHGHVNTIDLLLSYGCPPDQRNCLGTPSLSLAAGRGHEDVCSLLLRSGADANAVDDYGRTPMHEVIFWGRDHFWVNQALSICRLLYSYGAHFLCGPGKVKDLLSDCCNYDILIWFLQSGADMSQMRVYNGQAWVSRMLSLDNRCFFEMAIAAGGGRWSLVSDTTLMRAVIFGSEKCAQMFLDTPTRSGRQDREQSYFLERELLDTVCPIHEIIDYHRSGPSEKQDRTPVDYDVADGRQYDICSTHEWNYWVNECIVGKLDPREENLTLLHAAIAGISGNAPRRIMTETLIARGFDINERSEYGLTPLMVAAGYCGFSQYEIVDTLLSTGRVKTSLVDYCGRTALDWALELYANISPNSPAQSHPGTPLWLGKPTLRMRGSVRRGGTLEKRREDTRRTIRLLRSKGALCCDCVRESGAS
ncbi:hypothetical protein F4780DRAFT_760925 [Xylariomycetidae sp. FL0641]|nr:hypothetical protein F4780DRAFT_760925 [Xylariomycetidae sp. FL0641]